MRTRRNGGLETHFVYMEGTPQLEVFTDKNLCWQGRKSMYITRRVWPLHIHSALGWWGNGFWERTAYVIHGRSQEEHGDINLQKAHNQLYLSSIKDSQMDPYMMVMTKFGPRVGNNAFVGLRPPDSCKASRTRVNESDWFTKFTNGFSPWHFLIIKMETKCAMDNALCSKKDKRCQWGTQYSLWRQLLRLMYQIMLLQDSTRMAEQLMKEGW